MSCGQIRSRGLLTGSGSFVWLPPPSPTSSSRLLEEGESETRKTWRGPADPSLGHGPALIDVFVYARGAAVFQRLLGLHAWEEGG